MKPYSRNTVMKKPNCIMKCKLWNKQLEFKDKKKEVIMM